MSTAAILFTAAAILIAIAAVAYRRYQTTGRPVPEQLRPGQTLTDFHAVGENGNPLHSTELRGSAVVMLFVRGNWCPFCNTQVANLTEHYKRIVELGAKLVLVTPKPLQTTRRVAEFYEVEFDFWLDEDLAIARQLELLHVAGVPSAHHDEYGEDTVWPTAIVIDRGGVIRYTKLANSVADRPDPEALLLELQRTLKH